MTAAASATLAPESLDDSGIGKSKLVVDNILPLGAAYGVALVKQQLPVA
ncbi:hypothetical protein ACQ858_10165 [Variovorax ureilyticus]